MTYKLDSITTLHPWKRPRINRIFLWFLTPRGWMEVAEPTFFRIRGVQ